MERKKTTSKTPPKKTTPRAKSKNTPENFFIVLQLIEFEAISLRKALERLGVNSNAFEKWLDSSELNQMQYARAREKRADLIFEEMKEIADKQDKDVYIDHEGNERIDHNVIHRNKLQIDTRKWMLSKMQPKKYGDKLDITSDHEKLNQVAQHIPTEIIQQIADKL
jgi:HSP90 family molecular chaperone